MNKNGIIKWAARILILLAAAACLTLGFMNHGFQDVKNKAIRICYECIGIG